MSSSCSRLKLKSEFLILSRNKSVYSCKTQAHTNIYAVLLYTLRVVDWTLTNSANLRRTRDGVGGNTGTLPLPMERKNTERSLWVMWETFHINLLSRRGSPRSDLTKTQRKGTYRQINRHHIQISITHHIDLSGCIPLSPPAWSLIS